MLTFIIVYPLPIGKNVRMIKCVFHSSTVTLYITENPTSAVSVAGGSANFNCSAIGFPVPIIVWMRDGQVLDEEGGRVTSVSFQEGLTYWSVLTMRELTLEDAGRYQCKASNVLPQNDLSSVAYLGIQCK